MEDSDEKSETQQMLRHETDDIQAYEETPRTKAFPFLRLPLTGMWEGKYFDPMQVNYIWTWCSSDEAGFILETQSGFVRLTVRKPTEYRWCSLSANAAATMLTTRGFVVPDHILAKVECW